MIESIFTFKTKRPKNLIITQTDNKMFNFQIVGQNKNIKMILNLSLCKSTQPCEKILLHSNNQLHWF
jgi:hypothetical protein